MAKSGVKNSNSFLTDITEIRRRARQHIEEGAVTESYKGDRKVVFACTERGIGHRDRFAFCATSATITWQKGSILKRLQRSFSSMRLRNRNTPT